jgi:hypothetical protein
VEDDSDRDVEEIRAMKEQPGKDFYAVGERNSSRA